MGTQGEMAIKPKPVEERDTQEREEQRRTTKERNKNRKYLQHITRGHNHYEKKNHPKLSKKIKTKRKYVKDAKMP